MYYLKSHHAQAGYLPKNTHIWKQTKEKKVRISNTMNKYKNLEINSISTIKHAIQISTRSSLFTLLLVTHIVSTFHLSLLITVCGIPRFYPKDKNDS